MDRCGFLNESDSSHRFTAADPELANRLFGQQNRHLKQIERTLKVRIGSKGAELHIQGEPGQPASTNAKSVDTGVHVGYGNSV